MEKEYLKKDHLVGFDNYKYSCKDTGFLSIYVMHPFWNWLVQFCPPSIAPNLLTFTGFLFTVLTYLMFTILDYNFNASDPDQPNVKPLPRWTFLAAAIFLFIAYTLDGIDGKQARRTGTSTPLGELFDHGLDSYSTALIGAATYSIFGRGTRFSLSPFRFFFIMWNIMLNFYLAHFEKYNTGILFLPWGYDITMWGTILTFLFAGIKGAEFWQFKVGPLTSGQMFELLLYISGLLTNIPIVASNIYKSYRDRTGHMRSFSEAIRPLIPFVILFVITTFWVVYSPADVVNTDPRALYFLMGNIFSNISCRLIVAQMSNTRCDCFNWMFIPTMLCVGIAILTKSVLLEMFLLYFLCVFITLAHIHYGTCVVRQMCRHFKINCFTIKKQSTE